MDNMEQNNGKIILLNGTSSSGKSSLAKQLQIDLDEIYLHLQIDVFLQQLPVKAKFTLEGLGKLMDGFNYSCSAIARSGNNVIVDTVLQEPGWVKPCIKAYIGLEVVAVAVKCQLDLLEKREIERGDRHRGIARYQYDRVHQIMKYDLEVDTSYNSKESCSSIICEFIKSGKSPQAFKEVINRDSA